MKVLVTGAGGFLGRHLAASLLAQGVTELRLHFRRKPPAGLIEGLVQRFPDAKIEAAYANLANRHGIADMIGDADTIVHAAAGMRGAVADMFANSVIGTRNLVESAAARGVKRIVLVSSFSVYRTGDLPNLGLLDESTPLEPVGIQNGPYGFAKTKQEVLFREMQQQHGFEWAVVRPGVIYGPGNSGVSPRVGIRAFGFFFALGGRTLLPLTHVDNCADAVALVTLKAPSGTAYNIVDDDLPTCREFLRDYRRKVGRLRVVPVPYPLLMAASKTIAWYHRVSKGQLPGLLPPSIVRSMFRPLRYSNAAIKALGWRQRVPTREGLAATFEAMRASR